MVYKHLLDGSTWNDDIQTDCEARRPKRTRVCECAHAHLWPCTGPSVSAALWHNKHCSMFRAPTKYFQWVSSPMIWTALMNDCSDERYITKTSDRVFAWKWLVVAHKHRYRQVPLLTLGTNVEMTLLGSNEPRKLYSVKLYRLLILHFQTS